MFDKLKEYSIILSFITAIVASYIAIDATYAKASAVKSIELRLEHKVLSDRSDKVQERIWKYEDRYGDISKAPKEVQEIWRELLKEQVDLNSNLKVILEKTEK